MKLNLLPVAAALLYVSSLQIHAQTTLAQWNFESFSTTVNSSAFDQNSTSVSGTTLNAIAASTGSGSATGLHASSATAWSTPVGNGSNNSLSSNTWTVGDYYQFQTSTLGYQSIALNYDQIGSSTGPLNFKLSYSTDGSSYTDFGTYTVINNASPNTWTSTTPVSASNLSFDLSSIDELSNATNAFFRITDTSTTAINNGTVATAGTDRIDNFKITGTAIPEPSTWVLSFLGLGLLAFCYHRKSLSVSR